MDDQKNNGKVPFEIVKNELSGYRLRLELVRQDPEVSKPFEELDHGVVVGYFTQCYPGFEASYGSGWENLFGPDEDEFDEDFDE